jgi:hypothetical protein
MLVVLNASIAAWEDAWGFYAFILRKTAITPISPINLIKLVVYLKVFHIK